LSCPFSASGEFPAQLAIAVLGAVLIAHRHGGRAVPETVHQLGDTRAFLARHARPGVPKVVEVEVFAAGDSPSFTPPEPRRMDIAFGVQDRSPAVEGGFSKVFRVIALG
jgi:hypothetical protein